MRKTWNAFAVNADENRIVVRIEESRAPRGSDGECDWGNADWPSDKAIAKEARKILKKAVSAVRFIDTADASLDQAIYEVVEEAGHGEA